MPKSYRHVLMDMEVHERLSAARARLSEQASSSTKLIGIGTVIDILLNHAANVLPDSEWLKAQVDAAPKRGRPRTSDPAYTPKPNGVNANTVAKKASQHDWCISSANPMVKVCKKCPAWVKDNIFQHLSDDPCSNTKQTMLKSVILDAGFTAEELAWLDD